MLSCWANAKCPLSIVYGHPTVTSDVKLRPKAHVSWSFHRNPLILTIFMTANYSCWCNVSPLPRHVRHVCNLNTRVTFGRGLNVSWFLSLRAIFSWISSHSQSEAIKRSINQLEVSKCPGHNRDRITFHYIAMSRRTLGPKPWASVHIYQKVSGVTFH